MSVHQSRAQGPIRHRTAAVAPARALQVVVVSQRALFLFLALTLTQTATHTVHLLAGLGAVHSRGLRVLAVHGVEVCAVGDVRLWHGCRHGLLGRLAAQDELWGLGVQGAGHFVHGINPDRLRVHHLVHAKLNVLEVFPYTRGKRNQSDMGQP